MLVCGHRIPFGSCGRQEHCLVVVCQSGTRALATDYPVIFAQLITVPPARGVAQDNIGPSASPAGRLLREDFYSIRSC